MNPTENPTYNRTLTITLALTSFLLLNANKQSRAPYGKFGGHKSVGVSLDPRLGWFLMELPASISFLYHFYIGRKLKLEKERKETNLEKKMEGPSGYMPKILFFLWCRHYFNRGFYFPLTIRVAQGSKQSFALYNSLIGAIFLSAHGYLNARMFSQYGTWFTNDWLRNPRFIIGLIIYEIGFWITVHSEHVMKNLRPANGIISEAERYKIPVGGMFNYVTNASYLGELTAWLGFVILTSSPSALPVFLISLANLVPRSFEQHKWYLKKFPNYPKDRKVLIPFLL
jgi:3-oxo-5-alpha-steroid 4-dehydrogenase 1